MICSPCWIKPIMTDALSVDDRWFKGAIACLKCQRPLTQVTTSVKFQKEQGVIGILCLWDDVLIGTPTLFCAECVHPSFWGRHPPDWFRHRQGSIITLLYSAALPVRQHKRHIRAAHGDRTLERERRGERRGEKRTPHSCSQADVLSFSVSHIQGERLRSSSVLLWLYKRKRQISSCVRNASSGTRSIAAEWWACSRLASTLRWQIIDSGLVWLGAPYDYEIWPNDLIRWRLV